MTKLTAELLIRAYAMGVFPMAESSTSSDIQWIDPHDRGIIPIDGLHISRSLRKTLLKMDYQVRLNSDFAATMRACADREETWINQDIFDAYHRLHELGHAHSLEIWDGEKLVGGVYGVSLGTGFFGESMFSRRPSGSKIALAWLFAILRHSGFTLFDTQFLTEHLATMGGIEIPRDAYQDLLQDALTRNARIKPLPQGIDPKELF